MVYGEPDSLNQFFECINTVHAEIKFSITKHNHAIAFLDTIIFKDQFNWLAVRLHTKTTDKKSFLSYSSFHSGSSCDSIPCSQFLRVKRNCTFKMDFDREAAALALCFEQKPSRIN